MANQSAALMRKIGKRVAGEVPGYGYMLLVFDFHKPGIANYISNAQRPDMIKAFRETADRLEKNQEFQTPEEN